jgi:hypothetical protein
VWVGGEDAHDAAAGVGGVLFDADGTGAGAQCGLDGGDVGDDVGDGLTGPELDAGAPAPGVHDGRHDPRSGEADGFGDVGPGVDDAVDFDAGAAAPVGPPRDGERNRCQSEDCGQRRAARTVRSGGGQPGTGGRRDGRGVDAFLHPVDAPRQAADSGGEGRGRGQERDPRPSAGFGVVEQEPGESEADRQGQRGEFGAVAEQRAPDGGDGDGDERLVGDE